MAKYKLNEQVRPSVARSSRVFDPKAVHVPRPQPVAMEDPRLRPTFF